MFKRRGMLYATGVSALVIPLALWVVSSIPATAHDSTPSHSPVVARTVSPASDLARIAADDPMALVRMGREKYDREIQEYRCLLTKQERLGEELSKIQQIEVRFRENPLSVYMLWKSNADQARRALFIDDDERFIDDEGCKLSRVEPAGAIARLFVKDILIPIHGKRAKKASRRTIDECGFRSTFELLESYNKIADEHGVLDLSFAGTGEVDGRPTYIIERHLPYTDATGPYPDAMMILHLDQELLLPVAVYSYSDHHAKTLLGSYVFTQVEVNPGMGNDAFAF